MFLPRALGVAASLALLLGVPAGEGMSAEEGGWTDYAHSGPRPVLLAERADGKKQGAGAAKADAPKQASGGGGALPQGDLSQEADALKALDDKRRSCFADIADVPGGNVHFEAGGKAFYLLTQKQAAAADKKTGKPEGKASASSGKGSKPGSESDPSSKKPSSKAALARYTLYKVTRKTRKAEPLLAVESRPGASLIVWGDPGAIVSVVGFAGRGSGCFEGPASLTSVSFAKSEDPAVSMAGEYQLLRGADGSFLFDLKRRSIVEIDPFTFQTKQARKVLQGNRPLFWDADKRQLTTLQTEGTQRRLLAYEGDSDKAVKQLVLKISERVLQQGGTFALLRSDVPANVLELQEIVPWSGQSKPGTYKLEIPPAYSVNQAVVSAHFGQKTAVVSAGNFLTKANWQRVFLFDYTKPKPQSILTLTGKQYAHTASIDPKGSYAVIEVRDIDTRSTLSARIYDFATKAFSEIELPTPKS